MVAILTPPLTSPPDYVDNRLPLKVILGFMYLTKPPNIHCTATLSCPGYLESWPWQNISVDQGLCATVQSQFPFDPHYDYGCSLQLIPGNAVYSCATKTTNIMTQCESFGVASVTVRVVSTTAMVSVVLSALSVGCCLFILLFPCFASLPPSIAYYRSIADLGLGLVVLLQNVMEVSMHSYGYGACPSVLAQATQFFLFASQSWYFALALNSFLAVRNPFRHPAALIVYYNLAVWGAAFLSSLLVQKTESSKSDFHVCWISQLDAYDIWNWMFLFTWLCIFLVGSLVLNVWTWVRLYSSSLQLQPSRYDLLYSNTIYTLTFTLFYCGAATVWGKAYLATSEQQIFQDATLTLAVSALNSTVGLWDFVAWVVVNKKVLGECCRSSCNRDRKDSALESLLPPPPKFGDISDALRFEFILCSSEGIDIATRRAPPPLSAESGYSFNLLSVSFKNENRMCVLDDTFNLSTLGENAHVNSFRFTVYCAREFAQLRKAFGVTPERFCESVLGDPHNMKKNFSEGSSGSFFYFTVDNKYVVKTMTKAEVAYLVALLPHLIAYMIQNPASSLVRFYGLYSISMYGSTQRFVVMNNCLQIPVAPNPSRTHRKHTHHQHSFQTTIPQKEASMLSQSLPRGMEAHNWLAASESAFDLMVTDRKQQQMMHRRRSFEGFDIVPVKPPPTPTASPDSPTSKQEYSVKCLFDLKGSRTNRIIRGHQMFEGLKKIPMTPIKNAATIDKVWVAIAATVDLPLGLRGKVLSQLCRDVEFLASRSLMDYSMLLGVHKCTKQCSHSYPVTFQEGCVAIEGKEILHISVIDILQSWTWAKQIENWFQRAKSFGMTEPSSVDPESYARRILLMMKRVFGEWGWGGTTDHRSDEKLEVKSDSSSDDEWANPPPPAHHAYVPQPIPASFHSNQNHNTTTVTASDPSVSSTSCSSSSCSSSSLANRTSSSQGVSASITSYPASPPTSSSKLKQSLLHQQSQQPQQSARQGSISHEWSHYHPVLSRVRSYHIPGYLEEDTDLRRQGSRKKMESPKPVPIPSRVQAAMDSSINSPSSNSGYLNAL